MCRQSRQLESFQNISQEETCVENPTPHLLNNDSNLHIDVKKHLEPQASRSCGKYVPHHVHNGCSPALTQITSDWQKYFMVWG